MSKREDSARKGIERLPVASGGMSRLAYKHARAAGIDLEVQLQEAGLTRAQIENQRAPIKVRDQIKFLNLVASAMVMIFSDFIWRRNATFVKSGCSITCSHPRNY